MTANVCCDVPQSFRVAQVSSLFDLPAAEKARRDFSVELPGLEEDWSIGAIVGPSGSGKTTIARAAYGEAVYSPPAWDGARAVIDEVAPEDGRTTADIAAVLTSVGFSSPPAWVRPYHTLSNGEQFRCDLARALLSDSPLIVFDEFTSVVDRTVAKIGSAAIAKTLRRDGEKRFVAVTCHYDILDCLEVDWHLDMASGQLARRRLRRPPIKLEIREASRRLWPLFAPHHYLSPKIAATSRPFVGLVEGRLACWCSTQSMIYNGCMSDPRTVRRVGRLVVLPDYQGVGIGGAMLDAVAQIVAAEGHRIFITRSHPGMIRMLQRSPRWRAKYFERFGNTPDGLKDEKGGAFTTSLFRPVASYEFVGGELPAVWCPL